MSKFVTRFATTLWAWVLSAKGAVSSCTGAIESGGNETMDMAEDVDATWQYTENQNVQKLFAWGM